MKHVAVAVASALVASGLVVAADPAARPAGAAGGVAEWRQEAEAFGTQTTGARFTDANASGSAAWNLWTNGYLSTTFTPTTGAKTIEVTARGDAAAGVWPIMRIYVDNVLLAEETVASTSYRTYSANVSLTAVSHTLKIEFTNDAIVGGEDRNLKVDVATVTPSGVEEWRQEAEAFPTRTVGAQAGDSSASGGQYWNLWSNGYLETTATPTTSGTKQLKVVARGDVAGGVWPNLRVTVDGTVLANVTVSSSTWQTYTVVTTLSAGSHTVRLQFTNDAVVNGEDRNLKLDVASLIPADHEWKQEAESFTTKTAGGATSSSLASAGTFWNLWSNGHISTTLNAASTGRKEIRFVARGTPAAGVYPIVKVWLDSTLVQTLTVSATTFSTYVVTTPVTMGAHTLKLEFTNDATIGSEDRNVHLDVASLVNDNAFPSVRGIVGPANDSYAGARPALRATYADPDGDTGYVDFEVYNNSTGALVTSGRSPATSAGAVAAWTVPSNLTDAQRYRWRTRAYDGTEYAGSWTSLQYFTVDATAPVAPGVSSSTYPAGAWSGIDGQTGRFTFSPGSSTDVVGYRYGLDVSPPATDTSATYVDLAPAEGVHHLYVQSVDRAGNVSAVTGYAFNVGSGAVLSPRDGDRTAKRLTLRSAAASGFTGVTFQWRRASTDAWATIPAGHVSYADGAPVTWPAPLAAGTQAPIVWDAAATLGALDGPAQVRASFSGTGTALSRGTRIVLDQRNSDAATTPAGPGTVNLLTGSLTVSASDVSLPGAFSDLAVVRSYSSRDPGAGATGAFGPGWTSAATVPEAVLPYASLSVSGSLVTVTLQDGSTIGFTATTSTVFTPEPGAEELTLTLNGSGEYELADNDGDKTVFAARAGSYVPVRIVQAGSGQVTTYTYSVASGTPLVTRLLAPVPAGVSCTSPDTTRGCRSLTFDYAPTGTPVPGDTPSTWGDYSGRLRGVSLVAWDPDAGAMRSVELAHYAYDSTGRLRSAWDPRLPALTTTYAYDAGGHLTTLTPAGQEPWTFAYAAVPNDPDTGRLRSVSRSALTAGTATTTFVYRVPLTTPAGPYDLSSGQVARWGQTDLPTDATAVFPPNQVPDDNPALGTLPTSWERATVHYLDVNGREVDIAEPGGSLLVMEYDDQGNPVRLLTAAARARALDASTSDTAAQEAALAQRYSTTLVYSADGQELRETFGPEHEVALTAPVTDSLGRTFASGSHVRVRAHTVLAYDQGAPSGTYHLVTTRTTSGRIADTTTDVEARTITTTYDWTLRRPLTSTVDPGGLALVTRMAYDATTGQVVKETTPGGTAAQDTAHTRLTTYYTAAANSTHPECGGRPEWAGLVCRFDPGAQPTVTTGRPAIPSKVVTYDLFHRERTEVDKVGSTVLRTRTTEYDSAGRERRTSVTASSGTALPTTETAYSSSLGLPTELRTLDGAGNVTAKVVRAYDTLGRVTSYTDADNNVTTTTYDLLSRPVTVNDGKGTQTLYYDDGTERRGRLTRVADSAAGTFTAGYDADGALVTLDYPNGLRATTTRDEVGTPVALAYDKTTNCSSNCTWLSFTQSASVHDQVVTRSSKGQSSQQFGYDAAGRLVRAYDTVAGGCHTRTYTVDADANRTALVSRAPAPDGSCDTTSAGGTTTYAYDAASRLTSAGYVYDALGRTTSVPADDAGGKGLTATYFVNDLVASLTPQDGTTTSYTLDPTQQRFRTASTSGTTRTYHYGSDADVPVWVAEGGAAWTRNVPCPDRSLCAVHSSTSGTSLQLVDLHGDVVATASTDPNATGPTATFDSSEFGLPHDGTTRRYGWLGGPQRQSDAPGGITLMGVRLYNPWTGRFLQTDPVYGGSANPYDYAFHDPINGFDLDGMCAWNDWGCHARWAAWQGIKMAMSGAVQWALKKFVCAAMATAYWVCSVVVGAVVNAVATAGVTWYRTGRVDWWAVVRSALVGAIMGLPFPTRVKTALKDKALSKAYEVVNAINRVWARR